LLAFAGHTDVVPPGPAGSWDTDPFTPTLRDGMLYGRGAADMKSSIAAMVTACERFVDAHPDHHGSIAFLITSDEEGPSVNGTVKVVELLESRGVKIDWCLVGEPSSLKHTGDVIKNGRRGSLNATLRIHGQQGHVAYPLLADNPVHRAAPARDFWQSSGTGVTHISADRSDFQHPCRSGAECHPGTSRSCAMALLTESTAESIRHVRTAAHRRGLHYTVQWKLSASVPDAGRCTGRCSAPPSPGSGIDTGLSTSGGTSDGPLFATTGRRSSNWDGQRHHPKVSNV
jgi:succinyl-diaminopimelate desuccinylase